MKLHYRQIDVSLHRNVKITSSEQIQKTETKKLNGNVTHDYSKVNDKAARLKSRVS